MAEQEWSVLSPEEKRRQRFEAWLHPQGVQFVSPDAEKSYKVRAQRLIDAFNLKQPDRVPVVLQPGNLPLEESGINYYVASHDFKKMLKAYDEFNRKYSQEFDAFFTPGLFSIIPAKAFDLLGYKLYSYPGRGLPEKNPGFQFNEGEYMKPDEYDALIRDPSDFWLRNYLPRIFSIMEPFRFFSPLTGIIEIPTLNLLPLANAQAQASFKAFLEAGEAITALFPVLEYTNKSVAAGFPLEPMNGMSKAPFDVIADTLRGTRGAMSDMYRQPGKLLEALDVITGILINAAKSLAKDINVVAVFFPLHKGADGWMSEKQFNTFYWPQLKKVINAYIEEGVEVRLFAEGKFETRLESINEFPKGAVNWWFDQTDMSIAKKILGDRCCIQGNVPSSMLVAGSTQDVKEYCRKLIEVCGEGGGFILSPGAIPDYPKLENVRAMVRAVKEYS